MSVLISLGAFAVVCALFALLLGSPVVDRRGDLARLRRTDDVEEET